MRCRPLIAVALTIVAVASACSSSGGSPAAAPAKKPNIVFVLTDDLDAKLYADYPEFQKLMVDEGTSFSDYFVTDSLCCPSRSTILRGQFVHDHRTLGNLPPDGGFERFHQLGNERSTVATWMHDAGYRTGLFGKYLNGYPDTAARTFVPPGWDSWVSPVDNRAYGEFDYSLNDNGRIVHHGHAASDYLVDVLTARTASFIRSSGGEPFFAYVAPYVPHQPATPAPRHATAFPGLKAPRTPSFDEADVSDKPTYIRDRPPLTQPVINGIDALARRRAQSMLGVDDLLANVVATLRATGHLDDTYIVFSSDNGFHLGQHRLPAGKQTAYDEDIHVPLVVRGPGVARHASVDTLAMSTDLAPTFAALGGAKVPAFVDGRSLLAQLHGQPAGSWRNEVLVEHYGNDYGAGARSGRGRNGTPTTPTTTRSSPPTRRGLPVGAPSTVPRPSSLPTARCGRARSSSCSTTTASASSTTFAATPTS